MARKPDPGARDRILDAAARLFDTHGVHAVGLQQIIDECVCGKNLLYREFASKDELVVAYLQRCLLDWAAIVEKATASAPDDPAGQLVAVVRTVAERVSAPGFRGCPVRSAYAEFPDADHPAHQLAVEHYTAMAAQIHDIARRTEARDPRQLAERIMVVIGGLNTNGPVLGAPATQAAVALAEEIVATATSPPAAGGST